MKNHRSIIIKIAPFLSGIRSEMSAKNFSYLNSQILSYTNGQLSGEAAIELLRQYKNMSTEDWYEGNIDKIIQIVAKEEESI